MAVVLKIVSHGQVHRVLLAPEPDYAAVRGALRSLWPDAGEAVAKFADGSGCMKTLGEVSFQSFLGTASSMVGAQVRPVLRLLVAPDEAALEDLVQLKAAENEGTAKLEAASGGKPRRRLRCKLGALPGQREASEWQEDGRDLEELLKEFEGAVAGTAAAPVKTAIVPSKRKRHKVQKVKRKVSIPQAPVAVEESADSDLEAHNSDDESLAPDSALAQFEGDAAAKLEKESEEHEAGAWPKYQEETEAEEGVDVDGAPGKWAAHEAQLELEAQLQAMETADEFEGEQTKMDFSEDDGEEVYRSPSLVRSSSCPCPRTRLTSIDSADDEEEEEPPCQLWPATPECTPPPSPRRANDSDHIAMWMPGVLWVPALPLMTC
mmetsp:Transcript_130472/g.418349  ORF Transcript_130472/g.418349 Transcript_130472/m.418349 type:complete len:377 (-) Transcript_130472:111-1241(-)